MDVTWYEAMTAGPAALCALLLGGAALAWREPLSRAPAGVERGGRSREASSPPPAAYPDVEAIHERAVRRRSREGATRDAETGARRVPAPRERDERGCWYPTTPRVEGLEPLPEPPSDRRVRMVEVDRAIARVIAFRAAGMRAERADLEFLRDWNERRGFLNTARFWDMELRREYD